MVVIVLLPRFANPWNPTVESIIPVIVPMRNLVIGYTVGLLGVL
jgi:hypothetical protein